MLIPVRRIFLIALSSLAAACAADNNQASTTAPAVPTAPATPVTPTPLAPTVVNSNSLLPITVGQSVSFDASKRGTVFSDPLAKGLTYTITLSGAAAGLSVAGPLILGTPTAPGIVVATVTATDALGRAATDQFSIVTFNTGLTNPVLPAALFGYTDADSPLPTLFTANINGTSVVSTDNTPPSNPTTNAGATLGRVLFYDPRVSANDAVSCASCHNQALGFSDARQFSVGVAGGVTTRHAPGLTNARFYKRGAFFWDERAKSLEAQVVGPIQNPIEMGMTLDALMLKLQATSFYGPLFQAAFGSSAPTSDRVAQALAQYVRSMVSTNSRYDVAHAGGSPTPSPVFSPAEQMGEQLFRSTGCAACHTTAAQVSDAVHNSGLDLVSVDTGAGGGAFKAPSLRNVAVRPRYMHDGRFTTLEQVVDFYDSGVQANPNLDARLKAPGGAPRRLGLTATQKAALVSFMRTLTDSTFLTAARFSNPFAASPRGQ